MNVEKEEVLRKVKKLLALGDPEKNSNEFQVEEALRKARELLDRYQLDMSEVEFVQSEIIQDEIEYGGRNGQGTKGVPPWYQVLTRAVGEYCDCGFYRTSGGRVKFYGYKDDVEMAKAMLSYLQDVVDSKGGFRDRALVEYKSKGGSDTRAFVNSYLVALATRILARLREMRKAREVVCHALVLVKKLKIDAFAKTLTLSSNAFSRTVVNRVGREWGKRDGDKVRLHNELYTQNVRNGKLCLQ